MTQPRGGGSKHHRLSSTPVQTLWLPAPEPRAPPTLPATRARLVTRRPVSLTRFAGPMGHPAPWHKHANVQVASGRRWWRQWRPGRDGGGGSVWKRSGLADGTRPHPHPHRPGLEPGSRCGQRGWEGKRGPASMMGIWNHRGKGVQGGRWGHSPSGAVTARARRARGRDAAGPAPAWGQRAGQNDAGGLAASPSLPPPLREGGSERCEALSCQSPGVRIFPTHSGGKKIKGQTR